MTYDEERTALSGQVGGRNRLLLGIAIKGRLAGRDAIGATWRSVRLFR